MRIEPLGVGIYKLSPARRTASGDQTARFTVELYCERMEFVLVR